MTQEQKIQLLSKDFLDRNAGTLVASRQSGRLGWESTIRSGGAYSEFILHPKNNVRVIDIMRQERKFVKKIGVFT